MSSFASSSVNTAPPNAIGFLGLGTMGAGMAARLLSQGVAGQAERPLVVWNRTRAKCEELAAAFPKHHLLIKDTPREVVEACDLTYSILSTPEASRAVFDGDDGVLAGISAGKALVDCATLAETDMQRMNQAVLAKGGRFLEAPVSGSKVPAAMGTLIFLCAGSQPLFQEIQATGLAAMGKASHYLGPQVGYGTRSKLVINSLMCTMLVSLGEAMALSESVGLDASEMLQVLGESAIQSPFFALKGPMMLARDYAPNFSIALAGKDMALAVQMAREAPVELTVMNQAEQLYRAALQDPDLQIAEDDFSAIYEKIRKTKANKERPRSMKD